LVHPHLSIFLFGRLNSFCPLARIRDIFISLESEGMDRRDHCRTVSLYDMRFHQMSLVKSICSVHCHHRVTGRRRTPVKDFPAHVSWKKLTSSQKRGGTKSWKRES
jgi:hypothetical protein